MTDAKFFHLYTGPLDVNTYIVINAQSGFVVDPGGNAEDIFAIFKKQKACAFRSYRRRCGALSYGEQRRKRQ